MLRVLLLFISTTLFAQDWSNWRGPNFDGSTEGKNLPVKFSATDKVKWSVDLQGTGASTPVVSGNHIFLTAADMKKEQLHVICIDRLTGKELWRQNAGSGYQPNGDGSPVQIDSRSNYASPSVATDGKLVVCFFGNGDLICYDFKGKEQWRHNIQKSEGDFSCQWTFSVTPTVYEGKLYLPVLQRNEVVHGRGKDGNKSYILCYDLKSGKKIWKHMRPSAAKKESLEAFTTIIPQKVHGKTHLVLAGGDFITGHDPASGKELWRWGTWNKNHREQWWRLVPSHTAGPDNIFIVCAPKKAPVYAVQVGEDMSTKLLWKSEERGKVTSDVPTPLYYQNHFYILSDVRRSLSKVDPLTGAVKWTVPTPGLSKYRSSPLGVDGKVYLMNHAGQVIVFDAENGKVLAENNVGDEDVASARASIACVGNQLFVRTETKLFCISK